MTLSAFTDGVETVALIGACFVGSVLLLRLLLGVGGRAADRTLASLDEHVDTLPVTVEQFWSDAAVDDRFREITAGWQQDGAA